MKFMYFLAVFSLIHSPLMAQDANTEERLKKLENMLMNMQQEMKAKDKKIEQLEKKVNTLQGNKRSSALSDKELLDKMIQENHKDSVEFNKHDHGHGHSGHDHGRIKLGHTVNQVMETLDISVVTNMVFGTSNLRNSDLAEYQGGGHDPNSRGFNFQQMELVLAGTVDTLFDYEGHIIFTGEEVELEEAFIRTRSLPNNLQLKAGILLTEFGLINTQHLHSWDFIDQPIINSRIFGGDGMRGPGVNLSWLAPLPWYSEFIAGVQNSDGENMISFRGEGHGHGEEEEEEDSRFEEGVAGRPFTDRDTRNADDLVWLARWVNTFEINEATTFQMGVSSLYGENHTGGNTWIYGADFKLVVDNKPELGRPNWVWQTEIMKREYDANAISIPAEGAMTAFSHPSSSIDDWGLYTQLIKAIDKKWSAGVRFEYVTGSGDSFEGEEIVQRNADFDRSDRIRISPLLIYQYSEFTKFRLQYNFDDSDTGDEGHTIWFGVEVLLGKHPAHKF